MHQRLCADYIFVDRETVLVALKSLNPDEVSFRQAHQFHKQKDRVEGPNQLWHIDDNDKLKLFGFSIHECRNRYIWKVL